MASWAPETIPAVVVTGIDESAINTETLVATLSNVSTPNGDSKVYLHAMMVVKPGASASACNITVRRDSLTGTVVRAIIDNNVYDSSNSTISIDCVDDPGDVAGAEYVLTYSATGETVVSTIGYAMFGGYVD